VLEEISHHDEQGWSRFVHRLHRTDGPGWQHEIDELAGRLLSGCQGALAVRDLLALLAAGCGEDPVELGNAAIPMLRELVLHGMVLPADWAEDEQ
jgi:hypothetical protein